jgi:hypothetical protein
MKDILKYARAKTAAILLASALAGIASGAARAEMYLYNVSIPTDSLNANIGNGPFSIVAQLTNDSGANYGNNTVVLDNFNVVGPPSSISLTDNSFFQYDPEAFTPNASSGSTLTFDLSTTNYTEAGGTPDEYSFFIFDGTNNPIPTTDLGSSLFDLDLGGSTPTVTEFQGSDPYSGTDPSVVADSAVPEPAPIQTVGVGFAFVATLALLRFRTKRG